MYMELHAAIDIYSEVLRELPMPAQSPMGIRFTRFVDINPEVKSFNDIPAFSIRNNIFAFCKFTLLYLGPYTIIFIGLALTTTGMIDTWNICWYCNQITCKLWVNVILWLSPMPEHWSTLCMRSRCHPNLKKLTGLSLICTPQTLLVHLM